MNQREHLHQYPIVFLLYMYHARVDEEDKKAIRVNLWGAVCLKTSLTSMFNTGIDV